MPMLAYFADIPPKSDRRRSPRRSLRLGGNGGDDAVTIHDLSLTGALLETSVPMLVGAMIEVELPQAGRVEAEIVWSSGEYYGCQFELPVSPAALSAAQLKSGALEAEPQAPPDPLDELRDLNAEVERLALKMETAIRRLKRK
ncbi:MAG TPA: PilZ domain-containing protein [Sphingomicrobium sp.]|nr:PilZ domain-containing protein [Sphingomicrobium sp.]